MSNVIECRGINKTFRQGSSAGRSAEERESDGRRRRNHRHRRCIWFRQEYAAAYSRRGLDAPTSGEVTLVGERIDQLSPAAQGVLRNKALGFVYQFHHLLPEFTALENVAIPLAIRGESTVKLPKNVRRRCLLKLGLSHRLTHKPGENLSGGERQRVAVARALVTHPACVLADEPTGNLDRGTADSVFDLIMQLNAKYNTALVMVTHDPSLAAKMQRKFTLADGVLKQN